MKTQYPTLKLAFAILAATMLLFTSCGILGDDSSDLESKISSMESDISSLKSKVSSLESDISSLESKNASLESDLRSLDSKVRYGY